MHSQDITSSDYPQPVIYVSGSPSMAAVRFFQRSGIHCLRGRDPTGDFWKDKESARETVADIARADALYAEGKSKRTAAEIAYASALGIESRVRGGIDPFISSLPLVYEGSPSEVADVVWTKHLTPIEVPMWEGLWHLQKYEDGAKGSLRRYRPVNILYLQWPIGPWRADFFMTPNVIVECDGVTYHSDPEKVIRDKKRDRWFTERGFRVLRFSTPEIQGDLARCLEQVARVLEVGRKERGIVLD